MLARLKSLHPFHTVEAKRLALLFAVVYFAQGMWGLPNQPLVMFLNYQTDVLTFSQQFIGHLSALGSIAAVVGAFIYAPVSRRMPLTRLINFSIGIGVVARSPICCIATCGRPS